MIETHADQMKNLAAIFFAAAIVHTLCANPVHRLAERFRPRSILKRTLYLLGEVELVFGFWATLFVVLWLVRFGAHSASAYLSSVTYTEPAFVFVIMCMAATKPILTASRALIFWLAAKVPLRRGPTTYACVLMVGPLLGSLITEPAAMTVSALLLKDLIFDRYLSLRLKYTTLGLLFVNISIGGTLTHFAAPPVLMVAGPWGWDTAFMASTFGWKAALAIVIAVLATTVLFRRELAQLSLEPLAPSSQSPKWLIAVHLAFIAAAVFSSHHIVVFLPLFLAFSGWCSATRSWQSPLKIRESLFVGFFLAGLVTLGKLQDWWLAPIISQLDSTSLFWTATGLTAFTDNAALTYLGTLVPHLSEASKLALVSGAVVGGGLTVIANAPNPAGYGILNDSFDEGGINAIYLLAASIPYTLLSAFIFSL